MNMQRAPHRGHGSGGRSLDTVSPAGAVLALKHAIPTHAQHADDGQQERAIVTNDYASPRDMRSFG